MRRTLSHALLGPALALALALGTLAVGCGSADTAPDTLASDADAPFAWPEASREVVELEVEGRGTIRIALYPDLAPTTVAQFLARARNGDYAGTTFHRVLPGFMIQGGDPNTRDDDPANDGQGGSELTVPDEFNDAPHVRGALSLANRGRPGTGGSQFFIVQQDAPHLDGKHTVFGRVLEGMPIVDAIAAVETDTYGRWGPRDRPIENVVIARITPVDDRPAVAKDQAGGGHDAAAANAPSPDSEAG